MRGVGNEGWPRSRAEPAPSRNWEWAPGPGLSGSQRCGYSQLMGIPNFLPFPRNPNLRLPFLGYSQLPPRPQTSKLQSPTFVGIPSSWVFPASSPSRISEFQAPIFGAFPASSPSQTSRLPSPTSIGTFPPPEKTKKSHFPSVPFPPKLPESRAPGQLRKFLPTLPGQALPRSRVCAPHSQNKSLLRSSGRALPAAGGVSG